MSARPLVILTAPQDDNVLACDAEQEADLVHVEEPIRRDAELVNVFFELCAVRACSTRPQS
jgi:hypothetical protein